MRPVRHGIGGWRFGAGSGCVSFTEAVRELRIRGSLAGGTGNESGVVSVAGVNTITIDGDVVGGGGVGSGQIVNNFSLPVGRVTIGGSLVGGNGIESGRVFGTGRVNTVTVGGDVRGGAGVSSGQVQSGRSNAIQIAGSLVGGAGDTSGTIRVNRVGSVLIGRDVRGNATGATSGAVDMLSAGVVRVGGSIVAGGRAVSGSIRALESIGRLVVAGDLQGTAANGVVIAGAGTATAPGLGVVRIGGDVVHSQVLAGYSPSTALLVSGKVIPTVANGAGRLTQVVVAGDLVASSIVGGAVNFDPTLGTSPNLAFPRFGDVFDARFEDGVGQIGSVIIGGQVQGTTAAGDHFGIVAARIGSVRIGGVARACRPRVDR